MLNFSSNEFAKLHGLQYFTNILLFLQSYDQAESAVQPVKKKIRSFWDDQMFQTWLYLLTYCSTPSPWCNFSPAKLLMGRCPCNTGYWAAHTNLALLGQLFTLSTKFKLIGDSAPKLDVILWVRQVGRWEQKPTAMHQNGSPQPHRSVTRSVSGATIQLSEWYHQ